MEMVVAKKVISRELQKAFFEDFPSDRSVFFLKEKLILGGKDRLLIYKNVRSECRVSDGKDNFFLPVDDSLAENPAVGLYA